MKSRFLPGHCRFLTQSTLEHPQPARKMAVRIVTGVIGGAKSQRAYQDSYVQRLELYFKNKGSVNPIAELLRELNPTWLTMVGIKPWRFKNMPGVCVCVCVHDSDLERMKKWNRKDHDVTMPPWKVFYPLSFSHTHSSAHTSWQFKTKTKTKI